jgi:hypothetical protein
MRSGPIAAFAAALAVVTAGCASAGASELGSVKGAATVVPANAIAFVAVSADLTSSQWHGLGTTVLQQLPAWTAQLAPVAGDEVDVALLPGGKPVALVQPTDEAKLAAIVANHGASTRKVGDWTAIARDPATLDAFESAKAHLAGSALFVGAMNRLPDKALVRAYASGEQARRLLASIPGQLESRQVPFGVRYRSKRSGPGRSAVGVATQEFRWLATSVTSDHDGLKLEAFAPEGDLTASQPPRLAVKPIAPYVSALVDEIPAGVLAVVDIQVPPGTFELLPALPAPLRQAFGANAFGLPNQLDAVLGGETALYVRPGVPTPELTLVTQPSDTAAASSTLDDLIQALPKTGPFAGLVLHRAVIGGQFVVSTTQKGIDDFRSGVDKLSSDPGFLEAKKQSGMPDATTGFAYVNVKDALPLLALAGVKLPQGLPALRTFAAFGAADDGESSLTAFLGVG